MYTRGKKEDIYEEKAGNVAGCASYFCMTVGVFADAGKTQQVDYKTDYYMIVESPRWRC